MSFRTRAIGALISIVVGASLAACGDSSTDLADAHVTQIDANLATVDGAPDARVDATVDAAVAHIDATVDATIVATIDATIDATVDAATVDATIDAAVAHIDADLEPLDAARTSTDAAIDATIIAIDARADAHADAHADARADATVDATPADARPDAAPDAFVDHAPVAGAQSVTTHEGLATSTLTLAATDVDSDPLTFAISTQPSNGTLSGAPPNVIYTPNDDFVGTDSFGFTANDSTLTSFVK